ncbi:hypothetical protein GDO86_010650 [Hymenochirus boettgeri]|uniref:Uncharacterized protein n=1 Tax=Hymenochirus boettgeri TaxID=247094 RepID=A0A8T2JGS4_9PIPI|nr:hypothetical protein GDO86_011484 [Hymenochirus boettgeri]KAG8445928.1 hypothetical protein GDO86_010650 [Hymenochirus boettgeri]
MLLCFRVFLLLLIISILRCLISCCLQCWIKRRTRYPSRHTVTVVALSSLDSIYVTESSQCNSSWPWVQNQKTQPSSMSPVPSLGGLETGAPPSYEELFKTSQEQLKTCLGNQ